MSVLHHCTISATWQHGRSLQVFVGMGYDDVHDVLDGDVHDVHDACLLVSIFVLSSPLSNLRHLGTRQDFVALSRHGSCDAPRYALRVPGSQQGFVALSRYILIHS